MSRVKKIVKTTGIDLNTEIVVKRLPPSTSPLHSKGTYFPNFVIPNDKGNRAERRAAAKLRKKNVN